MDLDAVHDAMRARNAEGNTVPETPRDSPRPGRDYTAASDNDFTEVKAESEKGKCDVAPTEDEEEMNPPPSLTHTSESDRVSLRRQLGRYGTKRHRSEEIRRCPGRRRYQARQSSRAHHQLRRVRQEVQERAGVQTTTGRTSSRVKHNAGARCLEVYDEVVKEMASGR